MYDDLPLEHFSEIERAVEMISNFYQNNEHIEIVESDNQKKIIAYKKAWWSSKKNVVNSITVTYVTIKLSQKFSDIYDQLNIELVGDGKSIIINNGFAKIYPKLMEEQAQINLKTKVSGNDYIKALVYVIDRLNEKKKIMAHILK